MDFEDLLIKMNEVVHKSILQYKQKVLNDSPVRDLSIRQLLYLEAVYHAGEPTMTELAERLNYSRWRKTST